MQEPMRSDAPDLNICMHEWDLRLKRKVIGSESELFREGADRFVPLASDDGEGFLGSSLKLFPSRVDVLMSFFSAALGTLASILTYSKRERQRCHLKYPCRCINKVKQRNKIKKKTLYKIK